MDEEVSAVASAGGTRGWRNWGMVETIYEEEDEDSNSTPSDLSPSLFSPPPTTSLQSRVQAWSAAKRREPDVAVHVQDSCFHLHKDPLASKSNYLKRLLTESSEITLSPPFNVTPETFELIADFCYGAHVVISPSNVAALRIAAELLEFTESNGVNEESLQQKTETYFRRAIAVNREYALIVLRTCLSRMPEAETTAALVSKCIEALTLIDDGNNVVNYLHDIRTVSSEDFRLITEALYQRLTRVGSQDLLYRIIDLYFKEYTGNITDELKMRLCNYIDCSILSPQLLMHAVQNPRLPLRFVVQAMFIEQLNTRRSVLSAANHHALKTTHKQDTATLGALLERDAALSQVAQLKSAMNATSSRIQSLEKELSSMRQVILHKSENMSNDLSDPGRSASFRFSSERKVERGQRGSVSSSSFRTMGRKEEITGGFSEESFGDSSSTSRAEQKSFSRRLMNGLKSAFRVSTKKNSQSHVRNKGDGNGGGDDKYGSADHVIVIKKDLPIFQDSHSFV